MSLRKPLRVFFLLILTALTVLIAARKGLSFARGWREAATVAAELPPGFSAQDPIWTYRILRTYPHDSSASTQGLTFVGESLLESTGGYGISRLRSVDLTNGRRLFEERLDPKLFGEGVAVLGNRAFQLTWLEETCLVWDLERHTLEKKLPFAGTGWGAITVEKHVVTSNGDSRLTWRAPETMKPVRVLPVKTRRGEQVLRLNELEMVEGEIWANIFLTNYIVRIEPATGLVTGWIDCNGLLSRIEAAQAGVLNGIAYDPKGKRLLVTGKNWPKLFELELRRR